MRKFIAICFSVCFLGCAGRNQPVVAPSNISSQEAAEALAKNGAHASIEASKSAYDWTFSEEHKQQAVSLYNESKEAAKVMADKAKKKLQEKWDEKLQ